MGSHLLIEKLKPKSMYITKLFLTRKVYLEHKFYYWGIFWVEYMGGLFFFFFWYTEEGGELARFYLFFIFLNLDGAHFVTLQSAHERIITFVNTVHN